VAALAGLSRHAEAAKKAGGTKPADLAKVARAAVGAIVEEPVSADRSVAAEWMTARALALLPAVMQPLPRETAAAVVAILNDSSRSIDVRVRAATALGALVGPKSEVNPPAVIESVRKLAIAALAADEAAANERRFEEEYRLLTSGGGQVGGRWWVVHGQVVGRRWMVGGACWLAGSGRRILGRRWVLGGG
jgi:hypothetical protein